ncbi:MAG TPA: hypothetical protein VMS17_12640, partial [Gemmataceae bacterium]|nr:hypothetical protein [Gemmataceae bacterium]
LPADYTFVPGDAGSHVFSGVILDTAGAQSVAATDDARGTITGSTTTTVSPAAAARFAVGAPTSATAGAAFTATVTALDAFGNVATGYAGTVHFTSSDAQAALPADSTLTNGTGSFSVTLKTAGAQSITATDTAASSITGSQSGIAVSPATAATLSVGGFPSPTTAGVTGTFTVTLRDAYGNVATGYTGAVHFTSSDPQAVLPANYQFTSGDAGVHTFSAALKTAGVQSLTATDTGAASLAGTDGNIVVGAAAAATMSVAGFPSSTIAGVAHAVAVTLRDAYGNVATGYTGTVHFTSSDAQAGLPADYTLTAADAGMHTFSVALKTSGTQSITATDRAASSLTATQGGIAVSAAAAATFSVTGYPSATAGTAHAFTVTARDAYGNVATGYRGTVLFTSSDAQAALPANYTFTAGDAGVRTFSATLKTAGSQSLTATDTATAAITGTQAGILISAAAATHFRISAPANVKAGTPFTIIVTALDAFGNVAVSYSGKVHFASSDKHAVLPPDYTFVSGDNGVHTFTVTLRSGGTRSITATDDANGSITGSTSVNVA